MIATLVFVLPALYAADALPAVPTMMAFVAQAAAPPPPPLMINGVATPFILTVTLSFSIQ